MITMPILLFFGLCIAGRVKWGNLSGWDVALVTAFGLALASTVFGPPLLQGITALAEALFNSATRAAGGVA